jgi:hypothetical protein
VEDSEIAIVSTYGIVRGLKPGRTTVRASGYDQDVEFNIDVTPYRATTVRLSVASGPAGGLLPTKLDTGTFYALPADRFSSILEGLVLVGDDTVFCSRCAIKNPARVMRLVHFRSLNPEIATISNASDPFAQRVSGSTLRNVDTVGRVTAFDTTSTPVGFVMEVPGDELADTAWITFALRPVDAIRIRPDSGDFPPNRIDRIGTERRIYPNSDTVQGNFTQSNVVNFVAGIEYLFHVRRLPTAPSTSQQSFTTLPIRTTGSVTVLRENLPIVAWESALPSYLQVQANGTALARLIGRCAFISTTCQAPSSQSVRNSLVLNCADDGPQLPGLNPNGTLAGGEPIAFGGDGNYSIPSCSPAKSIPMPGALCTSASSSDLSSFCTIWIRASIVDQATGNIVTDKYRINVRR